MCIRTYVCKICVYVYVHTVHYVPDVLPLFSSVQLFYQAAGNVCNNGCHDKLDEGKVQEMVTGMLGDVSASNH